MRIVGHSGHSGHKIKMAICYKCKEIFYGDICKHCGWKAIYKCWSCKCDIIINNSTKCDDCGWFICNNCYECGCNPNRPLSNEEKLEND